MSSAKPQPKALNSNPTEKDADGKEESKKSVAPLEEDDEFEDFPVEGMQPNTTIISRLQH
jgi:hypothetical protein